MILKDQELTVIPEMANQFDPEVLKGKIFAAEDEDGGREESSISWIKLKDEREKQILGFEHSPGMRASSFPAEWFQVKEKAD